MLLETFDTRGARVLVVDDNEANRELLAESLEDAGYRVLRAADGSEALDVLEKEEVDLVLLDVMMPGLDGYAVCERIKSAARTRFLPVVMVTALGEREDKMRGLAAGADDFLHKPVDRVELLLRAKSCIRAKRLTDDLEQAESILVALSNAIEAKDAYTEGHAERVAHYAVEIGRKLGLGPESLHNLRLGGLLHDIGKIGVSEAILNKPGPLDDEEWVIMKRHPEMGDRICRPLQSLRGVLPIIRSHHERPDGSGYPDGLRGEEIPIEARIVCLADIYDALATSRSYKRAFSRERCLEILREEADRGRLDPAVVEAFVAYLTGREEAKRAGSAAHRPSSDEEPSSPPAEAIGATRRS